MFGALMLSSGAVSTIDWEVRPSLTIRLVAKLNSDMQILVAFQGLLQELYLLVALDTLAFRILSAPTIALNLIEFGHFLDALLVLFLQAQLKLQLGQHQLYTGTKMRRIVFDKI